MVPIPKPGERYRHFKNKLYQILAIATHSETGERMVVYQALYGEFGIWVRPLEMFLEKVDKEVYPDADQEYRFEKVSDGWEANDGSGQESFYKTKAGEDPVSGKKAGEAEAGLQAGEKPLHPLLAEFLDTESTAERLMLLQKMKGKVGQRELDSLCFCLDLKPMEGDLDLQLDSLKQYIRMQQHYDAPRMRWEK